MKVLSIYNYYCFYYYSVKLLSFSLIINTKFNLIVINKMIKFLIKLNSYGCLFFVNFNNFNLAHFYINSCNLIKYNIMFLNIYIFFLHCCISWYKNNILFLLTAIIGIFILIIYYMQKCFFYNNNHLCLL